MLKTVEGVFRNGKVELLETPADVGEARVLVTFLPLRKSDESSDTLTPEELEELRWRFEAWEEDWHAPGMEAYNDL